MWLISQWKLHAYPTQLTVEINIPPVLNLHAESCRTSRCPSAPLSATLSIYGARGPRSFFSFLADVLGR